MLDIHIYHRENEVEEVKEEGPKEMTLDEWKAIQNKDRAKVEFNIRKPNEGADGQWKKGFVLHKSKSEEVGTNYFYCIFIHIRIIGLRQCNHIFSKSDFRKNRYLVNYCPFYFETQFYIFCS